MPPSRRDWSALREELAGDLLLPGTDEYESARKPFIARFDEIEPAAVVRCATADDATSAMVFASRFSLETVPRSGGHCLAGYSSTRDLLLDLSPLSEVVVADDIVTVGAGTPTGKLCERLCEHGLAIPTGTCPSVGIAGLTLGGGIGILGRAHGLTLDHLVAAHVVLADGRVADCDEQRHGDLFWALRGAGARNFGVVTSFTFEARPAPAMTNFRLVWPYRHAAAVIATWQAWAPLGPDELSADLVLSATGDPSSDPLVEVIGAVIGSPGDARDLLDRLATRAESDPQSEDCRELSYRDTCRLQAELSVSYDQLEQTSQGPLRRQGYRFTKSELFERPLAADAIAALLDNFAANLPKLRKVKAKYDPGNVFRFEQSLPLR